MLPLFAFAGDLVTEPVSFEEALKANESLSLENMRALSSKRRGLSQYRGNARDAAEAAARSAAAEQYSPLLESLLKKRDRLEALGDDKKVRSPNKAPGLAMAFTWSSPLEGMGRKYTLADPAQECGMAWMLRAACKRQEAVLAVASCRRAPTSSSGDDGDDDRAFVVVGGSVLGKTPGAGDRQSGGGGGSAPTGGARRRGASGPGGAAGVGAPKSPGPVLGESAPAVATLLRQAAGLYKHAAVGILPALKEGLPGERPAELLASMAETMRLVCLAEAQAATARRAEEKGTALPLLCKLHMGAYELYKAADQTLGDHVSDFNFISRKLQAYILLGVSVHHARAHRAAAAEAAEANDIGEAIASCDAAVKHLAKAAGAAGETEAWRTAAEEERDTLAALRGRFVRENEVVFFEKVPEKPAKKLPEGKVIVAEIDPVARVQLQNLFVE